jgi:serine/threonine-protein kinase
MDLKLLPADLAGAPVALLDDDADELAATISPDGRWLAFQSDRSGRDEVYVTAFPESRGHFQISSRGGRGPAWSPAGDELFYFDGETLTAAKLAFDPAPRVVDRTPLFSGRYHQYRWYRQYDVHPDGEHFLMIASPAGEGYVEIVLDWAAEVEGGAHSK